MDSATLQLPGNADGQKNLVPDQTGDGQMMNSFTNLLRSLLTANNQEQAQYVRDLVKSAARSEVQSIREEVDDLGKRQRHVEALLESVGMTTTQQHDLQQAVGRQAYAMAEALSDPPGRHYAWLWNGVKGHFKVTRYTDIPRKCFHEALQIVGTYDGSKSWWRE